MSSGLAIDERGIATYTIDEASTRNALSTWVLEDIEHNLAVLNRDPKVRAVLLTGAGEVFSSGADRSELADAAKVDEATRLLCSVLTLIDESTIPVICRINGPAFGAGLAMVAAADVCVAVREAVFGLPEVRLGLVAGPAAAACLGRIGQASALDVLLTGRRFTATDAHQMQLVARVVERAQLDPTVEGVVGDLLLGDQGAIATTRRIVRQSSWPTLAQRLQAMNGDPASVQSR